MRIRVLLFSILIPCVFFFLSPLDTHAANVTLYSQSDESGEMLSQQATSTNTWITSESLGNLYLGKERLTLTFTMKDPNTRAGYSMPQGVALRTCPNCNNL
ncbi:MAG: hypothetical protein NTV60_00955, partial [Candidatus Kaiserbacteria bacterium]|nr:hypothetical protein [Candidatus Kaiserbacteria bacterium]